MAKIRNRSRSAVVAGGYARDLFFDVVPKDIDIWIPMYRFPAAERRAELARQLFSDFGQTCVKIEGNEAYGDGKEVWEWSTSNETFQPLNIIFTDHDVDVIEYSFDFDICKFRLGAEDGVPMDMRQRGIRGTHGKFQMDIAPSINDHDRYIDHLKRIKEKYPEWKLNITFGQAVHYGPFHKRLYEEGILEAGPILQTERQERPGDEIRLDTGAGDRPQARATAEQIAAAARAWGGYTYTEMLTTWR